MIKKLKSLFLLISLLLVTVNASQRANANDTEYSAQTRSESNISLSETEFNTLFLESLENDKNGQLLLSVSDALSTKIFPSHVELSAVINLEKVKKISPEARANVEKFDSFFLFLDENRLNVKISGEPVTRNGLVGIRDNFSIQFGPILLSNEMIRQFGLDVSKANTTSLQLNDLYVHAIELLEGHVNLATKAD